MLAALDVHDGHRVLEIGTGTGYQAALLSARLGDNAVTTIEIDAAVAQQSHAWWVQYGRPHYTRLGVTVMEAEQGAWLDHPDQRVAPTGVRNPQHPDRPCDRG